MTKQPESSLAQEIAEKCSQEFWDHAQGWAEGEDIEMLRRVISERIAPLEKELVQYTENRQVATCVDCGAAIWFREARIEDASGTYHPLCRVAKQKDTVEQGLAEEQRIRRETNDRLNEIGLVLYNYPAIPEGHSSNIQWRNTRAEAAEAKLAPLERQLTEERERREAIDRYNIQTIQELQAAEAKRDDLQAEREELLEDRTGAWGVDDSWKRAAIKQQERAEAAEASLQGLSLAVEELLKTWDAYNAEGGRDPISHAKLALRAAAERARSLVKKETK